MENHSTYLSGGRYAATGPHFAYASWKGLPRKSQARMSPHHFQSLWFRQAPLQRVGLFGVLARQIHHLAGAIGRRCENNLGDRLGSGIVAATLIHRRYDLGQRVAIGIFTVGECPRERSTGEIRWPPRLVR